MIRIFVFGLSGKMGKAVVSAADENGKFVVTGGFDRAAHPSIPTYSNVAEVPLDFDVIVDFSRAELIGEVIALCKRSGKGAVLASTGYTAEQEAQIRALSECVPVLKSGNLSVGVNFLQEVVERAAATLSDYDVEIVEKHHAQKVDAPSGTALMLADSVVRARPSSRVLYGRHGVAKRDKRDVTVHAVRGGTIVGEHEVIFAGEDETVTISHTALSRKIFAVGALKAAAFVAFSPAALYSMRDALKSN